MKKIILIFVLLLSANQIVEAQKLTQQSLKESSLKNHKKIVTQALTYNDFNTAINSMHNIVAIEGINSTYKDSLAIAYFKMGNYTSSHFLSKELLTKKPADVGLLEINAVSLQQLGAAKEAIDAYETLFAQTKNMYHGYQLANLQFNIKRLAEAQNTIALAINCEELENAMLSFPVDKNQNQNVPLKAAAYNLEGLIAYNLKDLAKANTSFKDALKIEPKFALATQNANASSVELQKLASEQKDAKAKN